MRPAPKQRSIQSSETKKERAASMPTLGIQTVDRLRDEIINGSMAPGSMIRDASVAAQLGISTIPLREALVQLAAEGLVELVPNRYRRVAPLSKRTLLELHAVFLILSTAAYKMGVENITPDEIRELERAVKAQSETIATQDWIEYVKAGARANAVVYAASRNGELTRMLAQMTNIFARVSILVRPATDRLANNKTHQQILVALKSGRKGRAVQLFGKMSTSLYELISQLPDEGAMLPALERPAATRKRSTTVTELARRSR
jgi:DNA-binding GntR family transcriptional regulator